MMRRKSQNEIMIVDEKQLLINSSLINEHEYLSPVLAKFEKISKDDLENPENGIYFTDEVANFFRYSFDTLMEAVEEQWEQAAFYEIVERGTQPCQLCGNEQLINIHKIRNIITLKELLVGSDCIDKFKISKAAEVSQSIRKKKKDADALRRQTEINVQIPNIGANLRQWYQALNDNPIVLPKPLETDTRAFLDEAYTLYENYINGKDMRNSITRINELIPQISTCFNSIESFNKENQDKPYVCNRVYKNWLANEYGENSEVLDKIKENDGFICNITIKFIHHIPFVNQHIGYIKGFLSEQGMEYINNEENILYFKYKRDEHYTFALQCSSSMFMRKCAELNNDIFTINMNEFKNLLGFTDSPKEIDSPIGFCNELLREIGYHVFLNDNTKKYFIVKSPVNQRNRRGSESQYSQVDIKVLIDKIRLEIYTKTDDELFEILKKYLNQLKHWKSKEEYKELTAIDNEFLRGEHYIYRKPRR